MSGLLSALKEKRLDDVPALLAAGADVNEADYYGITPLLVAVVSGNVEIARLLLDAGADVDARADMDYTPLHAATMAGNIDLVLLLLSAGADANCRASDRKMPVGIALGRGYTEILCLLLEAGGSPGAGKNPRVRFMELPGTPPALKLLIRAGYLKAYGFDYIAACQHYKIGFAELAALPLWKDNILKGKALTKAFNEYMWLKSERRGFLRVLYQNQDEVSRNPVASADTEEPAAALYSTIFHRRIGRMIKPAEAATPEKTKTVEPWGRDVTGFLSP